MIKVGYHSVGTLALLASMKFLLLIHQYPYTYLLVCMSVYPSIHLSIIITAYWMLFYVRLWV